MRRRTLRRLWRWSTIIVSPCSRGSYANSAHVLSHDGCDVVYYSGLQVLMELGLRHAPRCLFRSAGRCHQRAVSRVPRGLPALVDESACCCSCGIVVGG